MNLNPDFKDLLKCLNDAQAEYLVVGAYAVIYYSQPRYTKDIDLWIATNSTNAKKVYQALKNFGAPLQDLRIEDLENSELVLPNWN